MTAVHQAVELAVGTGVIGQSRSGLAPAIAASVVMDTGWAAVGRRAPASPLAAYLAGVGMGVPIVHFTLWPWKLRGGLPVLTEAEGLPESWMPGYNAVLYLWFATSLAGLIAETPPKRRWWALAGLASIAAFRPVAKEHFDWMEREAQRNPQWWNRAWASGNDAHRGTGTATAKQEAVAGGTDQRNP
jgi:hypothetical protein